MFRTVQDGNFFVGVKLSESSVFFFKMNPKARFSLASLFNFLVVEQLMNLFVHFCYVEIFSSITKDFVSRAFKFKIDEENFTRAHLLFKIHLLNFVEDVERFNICRLDRKAILGVFILTKSLNAQQLFLTQFILKNNIKLRAALLLNNKITKIILVFCRKVGTLGYKTMSQLNMLFCGEQDETMGSTIFRQNFLVATEEVIWVIRV